MRETILDALFRDTVERLSTASDWKGLVLHFLAYGHVAALEQALSVLRQQPDADLSSGWTRMLSDLRKGGPISPDDYDLTYREEQDYALAQLVVFQPWFALCSWSSVPEEAPGQLDFVYSMAREMARMAPRLARELDAGILLGTFSYRHGCAALCLQEIPAAVAALRETIDRARALPNPQGLPIQYDAAMALAGILLKQEYDEEDAQTLAIALDALERIEQVAPGAADVERGACLTLLAMSEKRKGRQTIAQERLEEAIILLERTTAQSLGAEAFLATALEELALLLRKQNKLERARELQKRSFDLHVRLAGKQALPFSKRDLAAALTNLSLFDSDLGDAELAVERSREALSVLAESPADSPRMLEHQGTLLHNQGCALFESGRLEEARLCFEKALAIRRELALEEPEHLAEVARSLNALAWTILDRDLKEATRLVDESIQIRTGLAEASRERCADLGESLASRGHLADLAGDPASALEFMAKGVACHDRAAGGDAIYLLERQHAWAAMGQILKHQAFQDLENVDVRRVRQACNAYDKALFFAESLRSQFLNHDQRKRLHAEAVLMYEIALLLQVEVALRSATGRVKALRRAVEVSEAARSRQLMDLLAERDLRPHSAPASVADRHTKLRTRLRRQAGLMQTPTKKSPAEVDAIEQLRREYDDFIAEIRSRYDPDFNPDNPVTPIRYAQIKALIPTDQRTAIIHFTTAGGIGTAFVISRSRIQVVPLPELDQAELDSLSATWANWVDSGAMWSEPLIRTNIPRFLRRLGRCLLRPLLPVLRQLRTQRLILVPHRFLHRIPLHACPIDFETCLIDLYEVSYAPSLSILQRCASREKRRGDQLLLVENPTLDLQFSAYEALQVRHFASQFECETIKGPQATKERLLDTRPRCRVWHFIGHARFNATDPLDSGLVLGNRHRQDRWLSLGEIFSELHIPAASLVVLSACESGVVQFGATDEFIGLSSGFLFAGADCVVSSLWKVDDLSTSLLMGRLYAELRRGQPVGVALRRAQLWLRDEISSGDELSSVVREQGLLDGLPDEDRALVERGIEEHRRAHAATPPFASPLYWGAFTAMGLAYELPGDPAL